MLCELGLEGTAKDNQFRNYIVPQNEHTLFHAPSAGGVNLAPKAFKKKRIMVYFLGGITQGEIAALRTLEGLYPTVKFIVATTSIIKGTTAINQLVAKNEQKLDL